MPEFSEGTFTSFLQTKLSDGSVRRIGYRGSTIPDAFIMHKKCIVSDRFFHHRSPLDRPPIIIEYRESTESSGDASDPKFTMQIKYWVKFDGKVRHSLGQQMCPTTGTTTYFYQIEEEFARSLEQKERRLAVAKWNFGVVDKLESVVYETVPFAEPKIRFEHSREHASRQDLDAALPAAFAKQKIDGVRVTAVWDQSRWVYLCAMPELDLDRAFANVPSFVNHFVCLFEYVQVCHKLIMVDVLYARNSPQYRNSLVHESRGLVKPTAPLIPVSLFDSQRLLADAEARKITTNLHRDSKLPDDGWLIIANDSTYIKHKERHSIELLHRDGSFFALECEFFFFHFQLLPHEPLSAGIYEIELDNARNRARVLRRRFDKAVPDRITKILHILSVICGDERRSTTGCM